MFFREGRRFAKESLTLFAVVLIRTAATNNILEPAGMQFLDNELHQHSEEKCFHSSLSFMHKLLKIIKVDIRCWLGFFKVYLFVCLFITSTLCWKPMHCSRRLTVCSGTFLFSYFKDCFAYMCVRVCLSWWGNIFYLQTKGSYYFSFRRSQVIATKQIKKSGMVTGNWKWMF